MRLSFLLPLIRYYEKEESLLIAFEFETRHALLTGFISETIFFNDESRSSSEICNSFSNAKISKHLRYK